MCLYTDERRRFVLAACLRAGAQGVVHKSEPADVLRDALEVVAAGGVRITRALEGLAELLEREDAFPELTARQQQVLAGRARGESFPQIASRLFISLDTAKDHMGAVNRHLAFYLRTATPAEVAHHLGVIPGDLIAEDQTVTALA